MTALVHPPAPSLLGTRPARATPIERALLRALRSIERATLTRVANRGVARKNASATDLEDRRTALALGGLGILPR